MDLGHRFGWLVPCGLQKGKKWILEAEDRMETGVEMA